MTTHESTRGNDLGQDRSTASASNYTFSAHNKPTTDAEFDGEIVDRVYTALLGELGDGNVAYLTSADIELVNLRQWQVGRALVELARADDCPLEIDRWSGTTNTPRRYQIEVPEEVEL